MARRKKKPCKQFTCPNLVEFPNKYCDTHSYLEKNEAYDRNNYYDNNLRNKRNDEFYHSGPWIETREYILRKYKGLDLYAFFIEKKILYADTVHHIEELNENWSKRLDIDNLIPLSNSTHNVIHAMYKKDKSRTQKLLLSLLEKWTNEYEGQGEVRKF